MKKFLVSLMVVFLLYQVASEEDIFRAQHSKAQSTQVFTDLKTTDWFYDNVNILVEDSREIIQGYGDGSFRPQATLSVDQFLTMVVRVAGYNLPDSSGYWAQGYIDKALELGFITEKSFENYQKSITREEMASITIKVLEYIDGEQTYSKLEEVIQVVNDSKEFGFKYEDDIMKVYKAGIIMGYEADHTFRPQGVLTRAEACTVVVRIIDKTKREIFEFDKLYNELYSDLESHLLGGSNWVDPLDVPLEENVYIDLALVTSDMGISPNEKHLESYYTPESIDLVRGTIVYDEKGSISGHKEDFNRLLSRRLEVDEVKKVMEYLELKVNRNFLLPHEETYFLFTKSNYLVKIEEILLMEWIPEEKFAVSVGFNIWYRDEFFIEDIEVYELSNSTNRDLSIIIW